MILAFGILPLVLKEQLNTSPAIGAVVGVVGIVVGFPIMLALPPGRPLKLYDFLMMVAFVIGASIWLAMAAK